MIGGAPREGHRGETSDSGLKEAVSSCNQTEQRARVGLDLRGGQVGASHRPSFLQQREREKRSEDSVGQYFPRETSSTSRKLDVPKGCALLRCDSPTPNPPVRSARFGGVSVFAVLGNHHHHPV